MAPRTRTFQSLLSLALLAVAPACGAEQQGGGEVGADPSATARAAGGAPGGDVGGDTLSDAAPGEAGGAGGDVRPATADDVRGVAGVAEAAEPAGPPPPPPPISLPEEPPTFERPEHVRGIYVNAWAAGSGERLESLIRLARATEINAFVIDLKDVSGQVSHSTNVEMARRAGAVRDLRIRDPVALLRRLAEEGIYPIARIVIVRDPVLTEARPELAIEDRDGGVWTDNRGERWLDPYELDVWRYHVELAKEALRMGFPEIQWDYVRFPDAPRAHRDRASYGEGRGPDPALIRAFLQYARAELEAVDPEMQMTADVFGVTTRGGDVGIGQRWRDFIDVLDVALPMVYPSHYWRGSYGVEEPNAHPYEIVRNALRDALFNSDRVEGAGTVRPWLQDFDMGEPSYGVAEVRAQMYGAYDAGVREWVFWNPSSRYTRDAFAPAWGYGEGEEPPIRVGGRIVPPSLREEALATWRLEREAERLADARADSLAEGLLVVTPRGDTVRPGQGVNTDSLTLKERVRLRVLDADSLRQALDSLLKRPDTTKAPKDTIPPPAIHR